MTYQVLARKWRPRRFEEVVGQQHVLRALVNALDSNRLHHALLFTGTRGVGKTTLARILAKCLNCEKGVSAHPCEQCSSCQSIDEGRFVDLIEVDAASRTRVDDTRELLDNVQYAPTQGRFKIYLIDEVHMLSDHSFNALLKTLEEPPPHVQFLLATTDPQKLPATILSRCLQFNLKRLPAQLIAEQLERLCGQEEVEAEITALNMLAQAAQGSLRDGLSLLDQAIAFGAGTITEVDVRNMLGTVARQQVDALLAALAVADGAAVLKAVVALDEQAPDYGTVLDELAVRLQRISLAQVVPEHVDETDTGSWLAPAVETMPAEYVQLCYQIAIIGKRDLPLAPDPRLGFEMILLRMLAFQPASQSGRLPSRVGPVAGSAPAPVPPASGRDSSTKAAPPVPEPPPPVRDTSVTMTAQTTDVPNWSAIVAALPLRGMARELAANCAFQSHDGDTIELTVDRTHDQLLTDQLHKRLEDALSRHYGKTKTVRITVGSAAATPAQKRHHRDSQRMARAQAAIETDPNVQALRDTFGAEIKTASIKPND